jgi:OPT oligopeptide transporter protein
MAYLPIGDTNTYDRFGEVYNISRILNPDTTLNHTAYEEYSAMYLAPPYVSLYLLTFAISTCILSHTLLYHGRTLWNSFRNLDPEEEDIHAKLMKAYPEVPNWWYWGVVVLFFIIAAVSIQVSLLRSPAFALLIPGM